MVAQTQTKLSRENALFNGRETDHFPHTAERICHKLLRFSHPIQQAFFFCIIFFLFFSSFIHIHNAQHITKKQ